MTNYIKELTDLNFKKKVLKQEGFFLVDFWADWCNPCKILLPILEEIAVEYFKKITLVKINIDKNSEIPTLYSIKGIPTLLLFKDSKLLDRKVGLLSKIQLKSFLDTYLNSV